MKFIFYKIFKYILICSSAQPVKHVKVMGRTFAHKAGASGPAVNGFFKFQLSRRSRPSVTQCHEMSFYFFSISISLWLYCFRIIAAELIQLDVFKRQGCGYPVMLYDSMKVEKGIFLVSLNLKEQCQGGPPSKKSLFLYLTGIKDWQRNNLEIVAKLSQG